MLAVVRVVLFCDAWGPGTGLGLLHDLRLELVVGPGVLLSVVVSGDLQLVPELEPGFGPGLVLELEPELEPGYEPGVEPGHELGLQPEHEPGLEVQLEELEEVEEVGEVVEVVEVCWQHLWPGRQRPLRHWVRARPHDQNSAIG